MTLHHPYWNEPFDLSSKPFTHRYSQPKEHRYSIDSIELCWKLGRILNQRNHKHKLRVMDLCSGCGVMGLEIAHWCTRVEHVDFIEVQSEYVQFFNANLKITGRSAEHFVYYDLNYRDISRYPNLNNNSDLIVCNPPYFRMETGSVGKSTFRNRCHYLIDSDLQRLCSAILFSLRPRGEAYILVKDLSAQGINQLAELETQFRNQASVEKVGQARGVDVVGVVKL